MFILACITDFFFQTKVSETARQISAPIRMVSSGSQFELELGDHPSLIIVDLAAGGVDSLALIARARNDLPDTPVVAFGAHVDSELLEQAAQAGARALSRSKFTRLLPEILAQALA